MIRFIINTDFDLSTLQTREENPIKFMFAPIPEMVDNTYLILCEREVVDSILLEVGEHEIIGSWNKRGEFYDDIKEGKGTKIKKTKDKFTKTKYKKYLKKIRKFENEEDEVGTLVDAPEDTLVINISGWDGSISPEHNRIKIDIDE